LKYGEQSNDKRQVGVRISSTYEGMDKLMSINDALLSLDGLSVGDAFGEKFFGLDPLPRILSRQLPEGIWNWTDDTHMALSIVESLAQEHAIHQNSLMARFVHRYQQDNRRGYGPGVRKILENARWQDWRILSKEIFRGGSYGNGSAMRVDPLGGYFAGNPERAAQEARLSAEVTHAHPEGIAGAVAVAVAAAIAAQETWPQGKEFLETVADFVPTGLTRDGIVRAMLFPKDSPVEEVVRVLGNGKDISAQDTVPFCLWCAAHHLDNYEEALWTTVSGLGDRDTTCAIVGGVVALSSRNIPAEWLKHREPFPAGFLMG
jgi:ADP-ribosylglycohydrolase